MRLIAEGIAIAHNVSAEIAYTREFIPLFNDEALAKEALAAARAVFGADKTSVAAAPVTASEDFAQYLKYVPGCFAFVGNGEASAPLHNPSYDFCDEGLMFGARFYAAIAERRLAPTSKAR